MDMIDWVPSSATLDRSLRSPFQDTHWSAIMCPSRALSPHQSPTNFVGRWFVHNLRSRTRIELNSNLRTGWPLCSGSCVPTKLLSADIHANRLTCRPPQRHRHPSTETRDGTKTCRGGQVKGQISQRMILDYRVTQHNEHHGTSN